MAEIALFVYGSLRPHEFFGWNRGDNDYTKDPIRNCTTDGNIYFVTGRSGYPVAKLNEEGTIVGDIVFLDAYSREWERIVSMEEGAGYELRNVMASLPDGSLKRVVAWHYSRKPQGKLIKSGDWIKEYAF